MTALLLPSRRLWRPFDLIKSIHRTSGGNIIRDQDGNVHRGENCCDCGDGCCDCPGARCIVGGNPVSLSATGVVVLTRTSNTQPADDIVMTHTITISDNGSDPTKTAFGGCTYLAGSPNFTGTSTFNYSRKDSFGPPNNYACLFDSNATGTASLNITNSSSTCDSEITGATITGVVDNSTITENTRAESPIPGNPCNGAPYIPYALSLAAQSVSDNCGTVTLSFNKSAGNGQTGGSGTITITRSGVSSCP